MHPFVTHYLQTKKASFRYFCAAALEPSIEVLGEIEVNLPSGTAANYFSKVQALRRFVSLNGLKNASVDELVEVLDRLNVRTVNDISKRKLNGHYANARDSTAVVKLEDAVRQLEVTDLLRLKYFIDDLLKLPR